MRAFHLVPALLLLCFAACKEEKAVFAPYKGPMVRAENVRTVYSDSGQTRVVMTAPLQLEWAGGNRTFPQGIVIWFYNAKGDPESKLTARKGYYDKMTEIYTGRGDVNVENVAEQKRLKSEELKWSRYEKRVYTDKFVRIITPEETLYGDGLTAAQDFTTYKILKIRGVIPANKL